eukprot:TRINITY_DN59920_c0_g1_i1.p1 TRINITY_DN59920_c0_g1~~TRINITY_DN59920_c0_g1_i1.p1  ORF type:complete len:359 (+),score=90.11 TRINITY_DN59920_c0_g1_i1:90-1079(+)
MGAHQRASGSSCPSWKTECRHFLQGRCAAGDSCNFKHPSDKAPAQRQVPHLRECCKVITSYRCKFGRAGSACCFVHLDTALKATGGTLGSMYAFSLPVFRENHFRELLRILGKTARTLGSPVIGHVLSHVEAVLGCEPSDPSDNLWQQRTKLRNHLAGPFRPWLQEAITLVHGPTVSAEQWRAKGHTLMALYLMLCPTAKLCDTITDEQPQEQAALCVALPVAAPVISGVADAQQQSPSRIQVPTYHPVQQQQWLPTNPAFATLPAAMVTPMRGLAPAVPSGWGPCASFAGGYQGVQAQIHAQIQSQTLVPAAPRPASFALRELEFIGL